MKNIKKTLFLLFVGLSLFSYAQQFQLTNHDGVPYTDGQTISTTITEDDLDEFDEFITEILVKNLTDKELDVATHRSNLDLIEGMLAYVCYGVCGPPDGYEMNGTIDGNSSMSYSLHLNPNGKFGLCKFQIDFMTPALIPGEFEKMTLYIDIRVSSIGVKEPNTTSVSLSAYPNPAQANSTVIVSYSLADKNNNHRFVIRNIMGALVMCKLLNPYENSIAFDAAELKSGVYFYTIETNNQVTVAKKLIIK
jgi:hypothetical protein